MRAITLRQPHAWAVIHAGKDIENRGWNTRIRGTIAIHAGKGRDSLDMPRGVRTPREEELVAGAIIGLVDIVDVVEDCRSKWFQGPFGFKLANPRPLKKQIPCKGVLSFWPVPASLLRRMLRENPRLTKVIESASKSS
jgi:hypothetical protein